MISGKLTALQVFTFLILSILIFVHPSQAWAVDTGRIVVKLKESKYIDRIVFHREFAESIVKSIDPIRIEILQVPKEQEERFRDHFSQDYRVQYMEPDYVATADLLINDPAVSNNLQWALIRTQTQGGSINAWDITTGDPAIKVAVVDTGIDSTHEDIQGKVAGSRNCTDSNTSEDLFGHGTHVAGIIAANTNNGVGIAGIGYKTSLLNAKALGDNGSGYYSWIADCIVWSADSGAKVINMSLGGGSSSQMLSDALTYAKNRGVVLVAAAGNSGSNSPSYPAYYPDVISVAAVDGNDQKPSWSNWGSWVKVAAPGVTIYSTLPHYQNAFNTLDYGYLSGTSMASPHVAGLAGLLWSIPDMSRREVEEDIESGSDKIAGTGSSWVYGRMNSYRSLLAAQGRHVLRPSPTPTVTSSPTPIPTRIPIPTSTPTKTPGPTVTVTPTPVKKSPKSTPSPSPKNPWNKLCSRFSFFCK